MTVVTDNAIDILAAPTENAKRPPWDWDWSDRSHLRAEHGYSLAVSVHRNGSTDHFLYDAGLSRDGTTHNLDVLGIDPREFLAVVLSHGHADHHGGLEGLFGRVRSSMPLVLHPHAWRERRRHREAAPETHGHEPDRAAEHATSGRLLEPPARVAQH